MRLTAKLLAGLEENKMRFIALALLTVAVVSATAQEVHELPAVRYIDGTPACPSDTEIKNIDTRLSSRISAPSNEMSVRAERQHAVRCRIFGLRYTHADWQRLAAVIRGDM
jgi:hypothetical protein